ncbi:MAG: hypothetical protein IPK13_07425 [Deltaproteobacteria bacterium]|nr:hypothetical protein [Deltaproteobacteria bacterium]
MTNAFLSSVMSHVIPQAGAQRLLEDPGHFPADLVVSGFLNPDYAHNVSAALQDLEKQALARGQLETAANYDFIQQEWEQETGLASRGATADADGKQDYWRDSARGVQAYRERVSGMTAGADGSQAALEQFLKGPEGAACFRSLMALYVLCCMVGGR